MEQGSNLINSILEIKDIIKDKKPDIFVINELNIKADTNVENVNIDGYKLEIDRLILRGMSRTGIYVKNNLNYSRELKYDAENESIITIKIGYPGMKKFILVGYYRQWQIIGLNNKNSRASEM